jgi:hypothetical protein
MTKTLIITTYRTAANATLREEELDGRAYLVAPVIPIRQQVMNGTLNIESEITAVLPRWGGIPLVMGHPQENGNFISANSPEVLRRQGVGYMFNPAWRSGALHAEAWLDMAKCEALGGAALRALNAVREGKVVDVSTGYLAILEEASGEYEGVTYEAIARNLVPDHLAILLDEPGACSVSDGCGIPRVNVANGCGCASPVEKFIGASESTAEADTAGDPGEKPPTAASDEVEHMTDEIETIVNEEIVDEVETPVVEETAVTDAPETEQPAPAPVVNEETDEGGAEAEANTPAAPISPDIAALVQAAVTEAMAPYQQALASLQVNADRQRCQLVNELLAAPNMAFTGEELRAMSDLQLNRLAQTLNTPNYTGQANSRAAAVVEEWVAWE